MPAVKRAVCVGINYPGTSAALNGCVNDAEDWAALLEGHGYRVTLLVEASREQILGTLKHTIAEVGARGRGWFTYSGHGTYVPDLNGDEVDGFDEALCPADFKTAGLITDDDLYDLFHRKHRFARWTQVYDACHSGTLSRASSGAPSPTPQGAQPLGRPVDLAPVGARARFLPPVEHLDAETRRQVAAALPGVESVIPVVPRGLSRSTGVMISGCDDPEVSYDARIGGRYRGAFTANALAALDIVGSGATYAQWHAAIRERLPSGQFSQTPQMQASRLQRRWSVLG